MDENPKSDEPKSPVKITVTDDDTGQEQVVSGSDSKDGTEPQKEPEKSPQVESPQDGTPATVDGTNATVDGTPATVDGTPATVDETNATVDGSNATVDGTPKSFSTRNLIAGRRESVALQEMDKQHDWLSEIDEKCAQLETSFISKIQYVALSNHYKKFLDGLQEKSEVPVEVVGAFAHLFAKFRTSFVGSQRLQNKLRELRSLQSLRDSENRNLESRLNEMKGKEDNLNHNIEDLKLQVRQRDKEKVLLQQEVGGLKEEVKRAEKRLEDQDSNIEVTNISAKGDNNEDEQKIRNLQEELESLQTELSFSKDRETIYQNRLTEADQDKASLKTDLNGAKSELQRQTTLKEKAEATVAEGERRLQEEKEVVVELKEEVKKFKSELESSRSDYRDVLKDLKQIEKDFDATSNTLVKVRRDLGIREERLKALTVEKDTLMLEVNDKQIEVKALKADLSVASRQKKEAVRRISLLESAGKELESKLESQRELNAAQHKRTEALEREHKENERQVKELTKEKEGLTGDVIKLEQTISSLRSEIKTGTENLTAVNKELESSKLKMEDLEDAIKRQEKEKERLSAEAHEQKKTISELKNEIKRIELKVSESEKTVGQLRQELSEQLAKYKKSVDDVKFYRKSVAESKRKIEQQSDQLGMLNKYIQQLKNYNQDLDDKRKKFLLQKNSVSGQLGYVKESLKQEKKIVESMNAKLGLKDNEEQSLLKTIADLEEDIRGLQRKMKNVTEDKDVLGNRLKEKDDVISSSKEKISQLEQDSTLLSKSLEEKVDDVKLLKLQLSEMHRSCALMEGQVENMQAVREELIKAQSQLQEKNLMAKGMEAEMQRPMNLHRWRILEGTDPDRAQLLAKTQTLQKQMIQNRENILAKETELREKDELVAKLREMLKRRSDDSTSDRLQDCRLELQARTSKLKCLSAENNMYENLVRKYKDQTTALKDELRKYKLAEFEMKSRPKRKSGDK